MSQDICRLCLSSENLNPIFVNIEEIEKYTLVLSLTTGLKIKLNDGLPQKICDDCTDLVNDALNLRNQSHLSEIKLIYLGYERTDKNKSKIELQNQCSEICNIDFNDSIEDCHDDGGLELKIEDKIKDDGTSEAMTMTSNQQPIRISKSDKKKMYLNLVDGAFDPKGPVKCKICKKTVSKWSCFLSHAKLHLGFNFVCEFCGKSFISSTQLKRHCRSHHGMERDLACKHCSYLALDKPQLVLHERRVHTGIRPYVCDLCAASYYSRRCLVQHLESHRTVASIQCDKCLQLFKSHRHLARHRYSAHAAKRSRCPVCERAYSRKYVRTHMRTHHDKKDLSQINN